MDSSEGLKENRKFAPFAETTTILCDPEPHPCSLVSYVWIGYKLVLKTTYPPKFNVQKVNSLTREMFKLVPLKILKLSSRLGKKCVFFKASYPLICSQIFKYCFLRHFFHVCAVKNASDKVKPFSFASSGLRAIKNPVHVKKSWNRSPDRVIPSNCHKMKTKRDFRLKLFVLVPFIST